MIHNQTECDYLTLAFSQTSVGPVLNDLQKNDSVWCCSLPLDSDFFVGCDEEQNVLEVNFANQGIAGSIVGEWFGLLSHLQSLDLSFNLLSGSLPTLSSMSQMTVLDLADNYLKAPLKHCPAFHK